MKAEIVFDNVDFERNGRLLLDQLSFEMRRSERWVILGQNGSGKSLLLLTLMGYITHTRGTVWRYGEPSGRCDLREFRRSVGYVATSVAREMHPRENVLEAVISGYFGSIGIYDAYGQAMTDKALGLLNDVGAIKLKDRMFGSLSDGEKARILIARAAMADIRLMLLDEPCANLDIRAREDFLSSLGRILALRPDLLVLMVTHHVEEITCDFTHALFLREGKIGGSGRLSDIMDDGLLSRTMDIDLELDELDGRYHTRVRRSQ